MQIFFIIVFTVIILAIVTIAHGYHWLSDKQVYAVGSLGSPLPSIITRTYNVHTVKDGFHYTDNLDRLMLDGPDGKHSYMPKDRIEYEKKRVSERMGHHLLQNGFIEVHERESLYQPYLKEVHFLLRVYKAGAVEETWKTRVDRDDYGNGYPSYGDTDYPAGP